MNAAWHIARKDIRRLAWPVSGWLLLVGGSAAGLSLLSMPVAAEPTPGARQAIVLPYAWMGGLSAFVTLAVVLQSLVAFVLAGFLVLQDPPTGTATFWSTRPISGGRLLRAKLLAAFLLLVLAPVIVLTPIWLADGFALLEVGHAALEFMAWQLAIVGLGMGLAALTENLGGFLLVAFGGGVAFVLLRMEALWKWAEVSSPSVADARSELVTLIPLVAVAIILVRQYASRREPVWGIAGVALAAMVFARWAWPFEEPSWLPILGGTERRFSPEPAWAREATVTLANVHADGHDTRRVAVTVGGPWNPDTFLAPQDAWLVMPAAKEMVSAMFDRGLHWGEAAARKVAGFAASGEPTAWEMERGRPRQSNMGSDSPNAEVTIVLAAMRGRVLWEVPLREGVRARAGSSTTVIAGLGWNDARRSVLLQERDSRFSSRSGVSSPYSAARESDASKQDCYLLVHRAQAHVQFLPIQPLGSTHLSSIMVSGRALDFAVPGEGKDYARWEEGATLLKVRFEPTAWFQRRIAVTASDFPVEVLP